MNCSTLMNTLMFSVEKVTKFFGFFLDTKLLSTKYLVTTYKTFVQPILQHGVLAYASTKK